MYTALNDGSVSKVGTSTVGNTNIPIYLNNGEPTRCMIDGQIALTSGTTVYNTFKLDGTDSM